MRQSRRWTPLADVGLPAVDRRHFEPLGAELEAEPAQGALGAALGAGGTGASEHATAEPEAMPIGARPSVPARIGVDFERVGRPAEISHEPYGMMPLEASLAPTPRGFGSPFVNPTPVGLLDGAGSGDLRRIEPYRQFVPPPPASQDLCLVNGFDPRWGEPPLTYRGVVMRFDHARGAYAFDPHDPHLREAFKRSNDRRLMDWYEEMARRYGSGSMLQPYKPADGSGRWDVRWIPRRQEVVCV